MKYMIREMNESEYPYLLDFLYEAIFIPEGMEKPPRSILEAPELQVYVKDFGQSPHDRALLASVGGKIAGAVWTRIMPDYGHIDDETPSFAIALYPQFRGQGIGTALMKNMLEALNHAGYKQASLSVQKQNRAAALYQRLGFEIIGETEEEYLMRFRISDR